jgi:SAM-dependent MidA family methyltransferase
VGTSAESRIRARIARLGKITFAEFMETALYHPSDGYYARRPHPGAQADYFTSPAAHPAFGALVSIHLLRMWEALGRPSPFHAVEMGAGDGVLAREVVQYAQRLARPFGDALHYVALDRSTAHASRDAPSSAYQRIVSAGSPVGGVVGCFLSNELVDAFPVHRFQTVGREAKEVYLSLNDDRFVETLDEPSSPRLARRLEGLGSSLSEGYRGEVNLGIGPWMAEVAGALDRGFVLTVDYGAEAEIFSPHRAGGTVQTYYRHTQAASPYQRVGEQDITAHVDFSSVVREGEAVGLKPWGLTTQASYLRGLGLDRWLGRLRVEDLSQRERESNAMAMRELVSPDGLGGFKVLVQEKGVGSAGLSRMPPLGELDGETEELADSLPIPLLRPENVPLMEGRYPHAAWRWEDLWTWDEEPPRA